MASIYDITIGAAYTFISVIVFIGSIIINMVKKMLKKYIFDKKRESLVIFASKIFSLDNKKG